jgi:ribosomal protein S18 acetylase RimI-like enzyme
LSVLIRRLGPLDAAAYQAMRLAGLAESPTAFSSSHEEEAGTSLADIAAELAPGARNRFGAFDGGVLVGAVGVGRESARKLRHKAFIRAMYVLPAYRGKGVGRQLMEHAWAFAASLEGVRLVTLGLTAGNAPAQALYETLGFRAYGQEPESTFVDGVYYDEILMVRHVEATR